MTQLITNKLNYLFKYTFEYKSRRHLNILPELSFCLLITWLIEWVIIINYLLDEWKRMPIFFPNKISLGLLVCIFYWLYLWGMAVWRRSQFGKFTRGERKLWAKAITSFWVVELVTAASFILIYFWLSWGPAPLVPRKFLVSRKGIILELVIYSYMIFLAYISKLSLKWNLWNFQLNISLLITLIFSYLLWKDLTLLLFRDNLYSHANAKWRNLRLTAVINTLSHEWWVQHLTGKRSVNTSYDAFNIAITTPEHPFTNLAPAITEYEHNLQITTISHDARVAAIYPLLNLTIDFKTGYNPLNNAYLENNFYPRRTGYIPKRLAMWQLLMILKMWHHLIILLWWILYIYKLNFQKKTSYTIVGTCYFNIYCCFILALLVYSLYMMAFWEIFLKFKSNNFNLHRLILWHESAIQAIINLVFNNQKNDFISSIWYCTAVPQEDIPKQAVVAIHDNSFPDFM